MLGVVVGEDSLLWRVSSQTVNQKRPQTLLSADNAIYSRTPVNSEGKRKTVRVSGKFELWG